MLRVEFSERGTWNVDGKEMFCFGKVTERRCSSTRSWMLKSKLYLPCRKSVNVVLEVKEPLRKERAQKLYWRLHLDCHYLLEYRPGHLLYLLEFQ